MRDYYDIRCLLLLYEDNVDTDILRQAFLATCKKRGTEDLKDRGSEILSVISADEQLQLLWKAYQRKYTYAFDMNFHDVIQSAELLWNKIR